jgi:hypothetical protein
MVPHLTRRSTTVSETFTSACAAVLLVCCSATSSFAQNDSTKRGFQPAATYALSDIETINTANGNLLLHVPLVKLPVGRGGILAPAISMVYNSKLYEPITTHQFDQNGNLGTRISLVTNPDCGWKYGVSYWVEVEQRPGPQAGQPGGPPCTHPMSYCIWKTRLHFPDGSVHDLVPAGYESSAYTTGDGYYSLLPDGRRTQCIGTSIFISPFV